METPAQDPTLRPRAVALLWKLLDEQRRELAVGSLFLLLCGVSAGGVPQAVREASNALRQGDPGEAMVASAAIAVLAVVGAWTRVLSRVRIFNVGREVEFALRERMLANLHRQGPRFFRAMPPGEVMSRATSDLAQIRLMVGFGALNLINTAVAYAVNIPLLVWRNPSLAALSLLPFPLFLLVTRAFGKSMFQRAKTAQETLGALSDQAQRVLSGMRVVRAYGLEASELKAFDLASEKALEANLAMARLRGALFPILGMGAALASIIVVWVGARTIVLEPGRFTVGDILAFQAHLVLIAWPTVALGYLLSIVQRGRASVERIAEIVLAEPEIDDRGAEHLGSVEGALAVHALTFSLEGRKILDGVTFAVPAGGTLAVVGRTGAGKSVLAKLLVRALDTPPGAVTLDGRDITRVRLEDLRRHVGIAHQESFLFSTTVARNIAFALGDPDAPGAPEQVSHAASEAQLKAEVEAMPEGMQTIVGERGVQLSGGQKQRVALARALLAGPRVLVLDDPLSAVDARTEALILDAIERAARGRTLVLVTHRVAAAARCDRVLVLDEGRVVEAGTPEALLRAGGLYARLAERQALEAELEAL